MEEHEEKLLKDAIETALQSEIKYTRLKLWIIIENIVFIFILAGVLTWIEL